MRKEYSLSLNPNLFIIDRLPALFNFEKAETNYNLYISEYLLEDPSWRNYVEKVVLHRLFAVKRFVSECHIITSLAYTYLKTGKTVYELSPYLFQSLYNNMNWRTCVNYASTYDRTSQKVATAKYLKKYLKIVESGCYTIDPKTRRRRYKYTTYEVTPALIEFAHKMKDGLFRVVNVKDICNLPEGPNTIMKTYKEKLYLVYDGDSREPLKFSTLASARRYVESHPECSTPRQVLTAERPLWDNMVGRYTWDEIESIKEEFSYVNEERPTSLEHDLVVNREEIYKLIVSGDISQYTASVQMELIRMFHETSDTNNRVSVRYFESKQGRHYTKGSALQQFPRELREIVLSEYEAVDMECSIFSLYKNLGKKYGCKKPTPEIDSIIKDRKAYRQKFVTPRLSYEGVKTTLTAIAYGAVVDIYHMYRESSGLSSCRKSSLLSAGYDKMAVVDMCNTDEIIRLTKELKSLGKFIIKHCTNKEKNCIVNLIGEELDLSSKPSFGAKMAHIYQSHEAQILLELRNVYLEGEGKTLGKMKDGIGLFLHDGIYVKKDIVRKYDLPKMFSEHIKNTLGFDVSYEVE